MLAWRGSRPCTREYEGLRRCGTSAIVTSARQRDAHEELSHPSRHHVRCRASRYTRCTPHVEVVNVSVGAGIGANTLPNGSSKAH